MKKAFIIGSVIIILALVIICFFMPQRLVNPNEDAKIHFIMYNTEFGNDSSANGRVEIKEYDSEKILEILGRYKSHLTLSRTRGYQLKDSKLEIYLSIGGKSKEIVLGNINFERRSQGFFKRKIINPDKLLAELLEVTETD